MGGEVSSAGEGGWATPVGQGQRHSGQQRGLPCARMKCAMHWAWNRWPHGAAVGSPMVRGSPQSRQRYLTDGGVGSGGTAMAGADVPAMEAISRIRALMRLTPARVGTVFGGMVPRHSGHAQCCSLVVQRMMQGK